MFKRTLLLTLLALVLAVPAALADSGNPPVSGSSTTAATPAQPAPKAGPAKRLERIRERIRHVTGVFVKHCGKDADPANADKCKAAAQRILARLQKLDQKLQERIQTIQSKCSDATNAPKRCKYADQVVQHLQAFDAKVQQLEQKVQAWLSGSTSSSSSDGSSLEGLGQLASDLASLQTQNP
jgi:hypothetical protein